MHGALSVKLLTPSGLLSAFSTLRFAFEVTVYFYVGLNMARKYLTWWSSSHEWYRNIQKIYFKLLSYFIIVVFDQSEAVDYFFIKNILSRKLILWGNEWRLGNTRRTWSRNLRNLWTKGILWHWKAPKSRSI